MSVDVFNVSERVKTSQTLSPCLLWALDLEGSTAVSPAEEWGVTGQTGFLHPSSMPLF